MISSPKAKAIVALLVPIALGLVAQVATLLQQGAWTAASTWVLVGWLSTSLATSASVYAQSNTPPAGGTAP